MASKKKQRGMVLHREGESTPAADCPPACIPVTGPGKASGSGTEQSIFVTTEEAGMMGKLNMNPSDEAVSSVGLPSVKHPASSDSVSPDSMSPDSVCRGIRVTLDNNSMWNEFFRCRTEMILTKQGSRMFPYCRFRISGLQPSRKYSLIMDIQPLDKSRYEWISNSWHVAGKAESNVKSLPFAHPESPLTGQLWMQNPVSFYKLKLTNNITDQEGNTILHPMHRYLPRLHLVQTDKAAKDIKLNGPSVFTFSFPQTEFMAVTAYQNSRFAQLKVDYNPFAKGLKEDGSSPKGLKLKLNSRKDLHKDGGTTSIEHHPVKKSLKSLLANHKPRSSKAVDSKPLVSCDLQKHLTTNRVQSSEKIAGECSRSPPAQKLFSELIREAHVSLQRCNLEQLSINNSICHRTERTNTKNSGLKHNVQNDSESVKTQSETSPAKKGGAALTKRKGRQDSLKPLNCRDDVSTDSSAPLVSQNLSVDSDHHQKHEALSEEKVKQHKRPAPLPLPALALFLKQHSSKSKKAKSKLDSPPQALPSESSPQSSAAAASSLFSARAGNETGPSVDLTDNITRINKGSSSWTSAHLPVDETVCNVAGQAVKTSFQPSSPSCPDASVASDPNRSRTEDFSSAERTGPEPAVPESSSVLPGSDQPLCTLGSSLSSTLTTSSPSLSTSCDNMLPVQNSPPAALPSDPPPTKHECLLPDPECSSFCFEPLSPASSPEPLPSLPVSLTLELETTTSEPKSVHPEEFLHQDDSAASVFKWHTVLPPSEPYIDSSFTTFQSTPQTLPLASVRSPVLSETPSLPVPQTLVLSVPPPGTATSFQENEQSLPFPTELSPLALQLPLSPTFSSLDGDGLSPTPSLADLVHLFSIDDDLGIGVEFSNSEAVAATCPPPSTGEANAQEASQPVQTVKANKPRKCRKKSCRRKLAKTEDSELMNVDSIYTSMQPSLEEVEEQLFISFTSKEALKLHVVDSEGSVSQKIPEGHLQPPADSPEDVETADGLEENIAAFQKILVRDLKLMRHRQVIHPVLQAVGLKMNLLDPAQPIDLQYLGVHLPPPGLPVEPLSPERPPSQGVCGVFVSRTGKTTDVTQIKGWREKFSPLEAPPPPAAEAGPGSDPQKKNLSAFCSDMLDEYLENEGKLIDQRADSFSQPQLDPPVYQLPRSSTSYVRTLDSVLKKQSAGSPTSDLISGFIPPSKRPKPTLKESRTSRRDSAKHRISKPHKQRPEAASALMHESSLAESQPGPKQPAVQTPAAPPSSELSSLVTKSSRLQKQHLKVWPEPPQPPAVKKRRKLKPRTMSQTLAPPGSTDLPLTVSEDLAPLESDSELGDQNHCVPVMTRALLRQKDLEDGGVWEGQPRTRITEERAAIALTSLFTLKGFVMDNPTSPVQVVRRRAPPCLNEFCRLGCVCCSLSHCCRISHCGRPACMLGCSCLKQKVVLLKNLDTDCCPSHQGEKKRRRKRRMKMAYVLKEADSVSQPAQRVQTLWKRDSRDSDPEPIHAPEPASLSRPLESREDSSCARVRGYRLKRKSQRQETPEEQKTKDARLKRVKLKEPQTSGPPSAKPDQPVSSARPLSPAAEPNPKPSKRLIILTESKWGSAADRSQVLQQLCERMARDQLDEPFWVSGYRIIPISQTAEGSGPDRCHQYRVHISRPEPEQLVTAADAEKRPQQETTAHPQQQDHLKQVFREAEPPEDWQRELEEEEVESLDHLQQVEKEEEPPEDWKQEMEEEEAEPIEDWQREVEEGDSEEEVGSTGHQVHDGSSREYLNVRSEKKKRVSLGLPFLTGVSPAGFLSTNRKQPGGTDHLVQVNGKLYPLAKIQLGQMGALHPANRLAAYLTGRVGSNRKQQSSSLSSSKPAQNQSPGRTLQTASLSSPLMFVPPPKPQPSVPVLRLQAPPTEFQTSVGVHQSAASSPQPVPEGAGPRLVTVRLFPGRTGDSNQVRVVPAASGGSATPTDSQMSRSLGPNPSLKVSQLVMVPAPGLPGKVIVPRLTPSTPTSPGQRMILKPVQTTSGVQYYRRPDGKLVRLVPISQLRSVNPTQTRSVQRVLLPQTPVLSVGAQISAPPSCSSSLPPLPAPLPPRSLLPVPSPLAPPPAVMAQRSTCSFKIFQSDSSKESMVVTCVKVPPPPPTKVVTGPASFTLLQPPPPAAPMNLLSLKPSTGRGPELGVRSVTVAPGGVLVHQKPQNIIQTPSGTLSPPPFTQGSQVTPASPPDPPVDRIIPEPTREQMDLDIVCVDDKTTLVATETMGGTKQPSDTEEPEGAVSSETENSSDLEEDTDGEKESITQRHIHNMLEKQRRGKLKQLLVDLRREVGQKEETSKICTLKKAVQVIQALRTTDTHLKKMKKRLTKRRDNYLNTIAGSELTRGNEVGLLSDMTDNSSDEERVVAKTTDMMAATNVADDVHSVAVETKDEVIHLNADHSLSSIMMDSKNSLSEKKSEQDQSVSTAFEALRSVMNDKHSARTHLLKQARREIQTLQTEMKILKSLKICLRQQRDAYLRKIRQRSGKNEQRILRKHLSSKKHRAANRLQASVGGGASKSTDDDIIISSSNLQLQTPTAPPSQTLSTTTPVQKLVPLMAPYTASHNATGVRVKMRTIPNILSRSKKPTMTTVKELPSFQALVPAEVLSLVTASLPGQPVLTLGPVMSGLPVLQKSASPGVASVTLNISDLTNQQMHLTSMPCPPNAENVNDLLQLVQPVTQQTTQQTMTQQTTQPVTQQMTHQTAQQQTTQQTMTQQPTQPVTQQTTQQTQQTMTQQITNQTTQQATQQTMTRQTTQQTTQQQMTQQQTTQQTTQKQTTQPPTQQQTTQQTTQKQMTQQQTTQQPTQQQQTQQQTTQQSTQVNLGESSSPGLQVEVPVGGALGGRADECLTSLLNEIVFLNQQTVTAATTAGVLLPGKSSFEAGLQEEGGAMGGAMEQGGARLLHPELDSVTMEMTEVTMSETHPAPAPPPLLQMKVGRAKEAEPSGSEEAAGGEGGVSWRPMPRLVPLGRTGNAPS